MARKVDTQEFIRMAHIVHGNKYDYSSAHYIRGKDPITITCPLHGDFIQRASNHLQGRGCPKCFQERNRGIVCGVGINDIGQSNIKLFTVWRGMLSRCYENTSTHNTSYNDCVVCDEWKLLSSFASWYNTHYVSGWQLDKDILGDGKMYSPDNCCFVPNEVNMCVVGKESNGVTYVKGKWQASFSQRYLGRFEIKEEAIRAYKKKKGEYMFSLAEKYKDVLEKRVYEKLNIIALRLCGTNKTIEL